MKSGDVQHWEQRTKLWVSFQELREEWKLFFNYWTASGREHWKPQYLELWSAGTHIGLGSFQGRRGNLTEGHHWNGGKRGDGGEALHLPQWVIWLLCTLFTQHWRSPFVCTCILILCLISISVSGWAQSCPTAGRNCWQCQQQHPLYFRRSVIPTDEQTCRNNAAGTFTGGENLALPDLLIETSPPYLHIRLRTCVTAAFGTAAESDMSWPRAANTSPSSDRKYLQLVSGFYGLSASSLLWHKLKHLLQAALKSPRIRRWKGRGNSFWH